MKRKFIQNHPEIPFYFKQSRDDFKVEEIPQKKEAVSKGNYLIVKIEKQDMSTIEMINEIEAYLEEFGIGYAGLKDKYATTTQYISIPLKISRKFSSFHHPKIKVLETFKAKEKLSIGNLEGNRFFIRLKKVSGSSAEALDSALKEIIRHGMPNYFGYQRFGFEEDNFIKAQEVARGEMHMKDKKIQRIMLNAYQSYLFNDWLVERVEISNYIEENSHEKVMEKFNVDVDSAEALKNQVGLLKLLEGDILYDNKTRKYINTKEITSYRKLYKERKVVPTGLLVGQKAWRSRMLAGSLEKKYDDVEVAAAGLRREAWIYPKEIKSKYIAKEKFFELSFTLPKGSYATVLLENLSNRDLTPIKEKKDKIEYQKTLKAQDD